MGDLLIDNFDRFGLLDEKVNVLPGMFAEYPVQKVAPPELDKVALLHLDGDSLPDSLLDKLYEHLSPSGYIIVKGYLKAKDHVKDFFKAHSVPLDSQFSATTDSSEP